MDRGHRAERKLLPGVEAPKKPLIAAARCVILEEPPPPELIEAWRCKRWGILPRAGGLYDQPLVPFLAMEAALSAYDALKAQAAATNSVEFAEKHPDLAEFCVRLEEMLDEDG